MKVEIVEFYANKITKSVIKGTLHVYLIDLEVDIRGVIVSSFKNKWYFMLPTKRGFDVDEKKEIVYPIIEFSNPKMKEELLEFLGQEGPAFVKEKIKQNPKLVRVLKPSFNSVGNKSKPEFRKPFKKRDSHAEKKQWTFKKERF